MLIGAYTNNNKIGKIGIFGLKMLNFLLYQKNPKKIKNPSQKKQIQKICKKKMGKGQKIAKKFAFFENCAIL